MVQSLKHLLSLYRKDWPTPGAEHGSCLAPCHVLPGARVLLLPPGGQSLKSKSMRKLCLLSLLLKMFYFQFQLFLPRLPRSLVLFWPLSGRSPAWSPVMTLHFPRDSCFWVLVSVSFVGFFSLPAFNVSAFCMLVGFGIFSQSWSQCFLGLSLAHGSHSSHPATPPNSSQGDQVSP